MRPEKKSRQNDFFALGFFALGFFASQPILLKLLEHIAHAEKEDVAAAERLLESYPELLYMFSNVMDYSLRKFPKVSALQRFGIPWNLHPQVLVFLPLLYVPIGPVPTNAQRWVQRAVQWRQRRLGRNLEIILRIIRS